MTTKEKLEKALEALILIRNEHGPVSKTHLIADAAINAITTTRTETVEVKRWVNVYSDGTLGGTLYDRKADALNGMDRRRGIPEQEEITIKFERPIPKPEVWKGEVDTDRHWDTCIRGVPKEWIGKRVIVEVCE